MKSCMRHIVPGFALFSLLLPANLLAQVSPSLVDYARPHLSWYTIETDHFYIHFHGEANGSASSRTAQIVARVAEDVYDEITGLYAHEPDSKVSIILKDYEDYSNGAAYFFDNKIEIWVPALDTPLRGSGNWLRNVISHEFTHIIQVQKAVKSTRTWPIAYMQWLRYEDVKRPDVLYGYPSGIVSYPVPALNNPAWFAEGTAQYQRRSMDYDRWDSHRDMLLRMKIVEGEAFRLGDMGSFFNKNSLQREQVYNTGYAFTLYLANRFGENVLQDISTALSEWTVWTVEGAIEKATGLSGTTVFQEWYDSLKTEYGDSLEELGQRIEGKTVHAEGWLNRSPRFSTRGDSLAFISNAGEDYSMASLYVQNLSSGEATAFHLDDVAIETGGFTCSNGVRLKRGVGASVSWHPDGGRIAYARTIDTPHGHLASDLFVYDLNKRASRRLTTALRASSPAYDHSGERLAFVWQRDGSRNLGILDIAAGDTTAVTRYEDGTQVYEPVWGPKDEWIYFSANRGFNRSIHRIRPDGSDETVLLASEHDMRSPRPRENGQSLVFSSDATGIYNLYEVGLPRAGEPVEQDVPLRFESAIKLTNVWGGALGPDVSINGQIAFERYTAGGYSINILGVGSAESQPSDHPYQPPKMFSKALTGERDHHLARRAVEDATVDPIPAGELHDIAEDSMLQSVVRQAVGEPFQGISAYSNTFTSFTFLPVLRFDMYAKRGRLSGRAGDGGFQGGRLWRNTKLGLYMSSREVLEGISIFGGFLVGPGSKRHKSLGDAFAPSNLVRLERDIFLQMDYKKGFKAIPKRWSPQVSVEMFHVRRNVQQGLTIEESACTACYPDTTAADIAYSLWEAGLYLRSKPARSLLLEAGIRYSPYKVRTESFYSREYRQTITASSSRYFIGRALSFRVSYEAQKSFRHSDVVPVGVKAEVGYEYEPGRLLDSFEIRDGTLVANYAGYDNHRLSMDARYAHRLGTHGLALRMRATTIAGSAVDDFFDDYVGGLTGARGYPFYSLGGNETVWLNLSYYLPVFPEINRQFLFLYATKLYGRLYVDAAAAWTSSEDVRPVFRKDVGAELRLGLGSFYLFPTAAFVSATYALDSFSYTVDPRFVGPVGSKEITYGKSLSWHFGLLFEFDI